MSLFYIIPGIIMNLLKKAFLVPSLLLVTLLISGCEEKQNKIECLTEEIKELEWNIESLEKMMEYYKKREKKEKRKPFYRWRG